MFVIRTENRDDLQQYLSEDGIASLIHYPIPVQQQKAFTGRSGDCLNTHNFCERLVSLPINPEMDAEEVSHVVSTVSAWLQLHPDALR